GSGRLTGEPFEQLGVEMLRNSWPGIDDGDLDLTITYLLCGEGGRPATVPRGIAQQVVENLVQVPRLDERDQVTGTFDGRLSAGGLSQGGGTQVWLQAAMLGHCDQCASFAAHQ